MLNFDLINEPLTSQEMSEECERLSLDVRRHVKTRCLIAIGLHAFVVAIVAAIAHWLHLLPDAVFITNCISFMMLHLAFGFFLFRSLTNIFIALFLSMSFVAFFSIVLVETGSVIIAFCVAAIGLVLGFCLIGGILVAHSVGGLVDDLRNCKKSLLPANKESCLEIEEWMADPVIDAYRYRVAQSGREITQGEVDAMRSWWQSTDAREQENAKAVAVEAACKKVYFSKPLVQC